ncbi:hypothetical protein D3C87_1013830 [compost metagenome]
MLWNAIVVVGDGRACQISRIAGAGGSVSGSANLDRAISAFAKKIQAMVEILSERHEEDVGIGFRKVCFLCTQNVADVSRIESIKDRVDRGISKGIRFSVVRLGDADEWCVHRTCVGICSIISMTRQGADTCWDRIITIVGWKTVHEGFETSQITWCVFEVTGNVVTVLA